MLSKLEWLEVAGALFEVEKREVQQHGGATNGNEVTRSRLWTRPSGAADHLEIFGLDSHDV